MKSFSHDKELRRRRLAALSDEVGPGTLAKKSGIDPALIYQMSKGSGKNKRGVNDDNARALEIAGGKPAGWLDIDDSNNVTAYHPDDPLPDDVVLIKESEVTFKNGTGHDLVYEIIEDSEPATYRLSWFQKERLNPKHCKRFKCSGESNEPFVFAGDTILVNLDETSIRNGKVYAFWHEGEGRRMKKLFQKTDGTLTLKSFNADYPDETVSANEAAEKITIIGRVRDKSGRGGL